MDWSHGQRDTEANVRTRSPRRISDLPLRLGVAAASLCVALTVILSQEKTATPADSKPAESTPVETVPSEAKPAEAKPADAKPAATDLAQEKTAEATPAETAPADTTHVDTTPKEPPPPPTEAEIAEIVWEEFAVDNDFVCPFAEDFSRHDDYPEIKTDWENFLAKFALWQPGQAFDVTEKVRNLITACALMDIGQGQFESELPLFVYQRLRREVPDAKLKDILAYMAFHPDQGVVIETAPELDLDIGVGDDQIRERLQIYAVKMLGRVLGKLPWVPPEQP